MSEGIVLGHAALTAGTGDCGCCHGVTAGTMPVLFNRPGLDAITYRIGTHARFKQAMLARLSSMDHPALARLRTRDDDDFSIALLDAWAVVADVLTFYQERVANESYLATATERLSILELARLIGYRPRPGVAAEAHLAFTLEPSGAVAQTTVPAGTRVQSVPGPGETAQTFETVEDLLARPAWNALRPRRSHLVKPNRPGDTVTYLQGVTNNLTPGDVVLFVGPERELDPGNENWDARRLTRVETDVEADVTRIEWSPGLGSLHPSGVPSADPQIYVFRTRAALFGYNAPHPMLLPQETRTRYGFAQDSTADWGFTIIGSDIDLDNLYPAITQGSWLVLAKSTYQEVYQAKTVTEGGRADFGTSGRVTRITLTGENLHLFDGSAYRSTTVFAHSERLALAEAPITEPVWGKEVVLDHRAEGLAHGRILIVRGKRAKLRVLAEGLVLTTGHDPPEVQLVPAGQLLTLLAPPADVAGGVDSVDSVGSVDRQWRVRTEGGVEGTVTTSADSFADTPAGDDDPPVAELAILDTVEAADDTHTRLVWTQPLSFAYDRAGTEILANVARMTHGESVGEILGSGGAGRPYQRFALKGAPLTYVGADNPAGAESTLQVRVDDVRWQEVPFLFGRGPAERVYATHTDDAGTTHIVFGDGSTGARPPSGVDNVHATYRKGIGLGGLVPANSLQILLSRPLGVREATNPLAAEGGDDPESRDDARRNAPVSVLTLDRAVSLRDYEDFARTFSGVAKALATWTWQGETRTVFVTVAGPGGAAVTGTTRERLLAALRGAGDPFVSVEVGTYRPVAFHLELTASVHPDHSEATVRADVETALRTAFAFTARAFGQPVALSEVVRVVHAVDGVVAVHVDRLHRTTPPQATPARHPRLVALPARVDAEGTLVAAELLTIEDAPLELGVIL